MTRLDEIKKNFLAGGMSFGEATMFDGSQLLKDQELLEMNHEKALAEEEVE